MKLFLSTFFFTIGTCAAIAQTVLEYNLQEGDVFTVKQSAEQIIKQELDGASHVLTNALDGILEFTVLNETDNNYQITITFKDLNLLMTSSIQGELMNVRAKEVKEGDMQSKIFNSLLDQPVEMTVAKTGDILKVVGGDSLVARMASSSGLEDEFTLNLMKKSLEKEFGSEALSNSYKQLTFIYTDNEVAIGDSWQNEYAGKLAAKNTWTLNSLESEKVEISGQAIVTMDIDDPSTTMNLTGAQQTEITTNRANGFISQMKVISEASGISTMPQMGVQEIPTTISSTITYELIE